MLGISAVEHIADLVKHTSEERALWNTVADKANTADVEALSGKGHTGHNHDAGIIQKLKYQP